MVLVEKWSYMNHFGVYSFGAIFKNFGLKILTYWSVLMDKVGNFIHKALVEIQIWALELLGLGVKSLIH